MEAVVMWPTSALPRAQDEKSFDRASVDYVEKLPGQTTLLPIAQNAYCFGDIYLLYGKSYRSVILAVKRKLSDCHWSKSTRAVLRREYRLAH